MNDFRNARVPTEGGVSGIDRKVLWVIRELGLPAIVRVCVSCWSTRHRPTGKFRVNANGKLLDVWLLICCELCGRTSKIAVHERIHVRALDSRRRLMFENNDSSMVRHLVMDGALAGKAAYRLDWSGTWELETDVPFYEVERDDRVSLEVVIRFEFPAPIRVERLLMAGFGLSRSTVRGMVDSGRIRLPMAFDAKAREDFSLFVVATPPVVRAVSGVTSHRAGSTSASAHRSTSATARSPRAGGVLQAEQDRIVWTADFAGPGTPDPRIRPGGAHALPESFHPLSQQN